MVEQAKIARVTSLKSTDSDFDKYQVFLNNGLVRHDLVVSADSVAGTLTRLKIDGDGIKKADGSNETVHGNVVISPLAPGHEHFRQGGVHKEADAPASAVSAPQPVTQPVTQPAAAPAAAPKS